MLNFNSFARWNGYGHQASLEDHMSLINRRSLLTPAVLVAGSGCLIAKSAAAFAGHSHVDPLGSHAGQHPIASESLMAETANRFLPALDSEQRAKASFVLMSMKAQLALHSEELKGLALREMSPYPTPITIVCRPPLFSSSLMTLRTAQSTSTLSRVI